MSANLSRGAMFITYGGGHIAKVAPVVRELQQRGVRCTVLALTIGHAVALQMGLEPLGYRDFLHLVDADRATRYGRELLEGNRHPQVDEHESCCYLGINYLDWVDRYGDEEAARRYAAGGRRTFYPIGFMRSVLQDVRPDVVVSTGSPRSEHAALEAARDLGIPSLTILDLFGLPYDPYPRQPVTADRITVMSEFVRGNLLAAGISDAKLRVTGCPAYDAMHDPAHAQAGAAWRRSLGWDGLHVVMWAGYMEEGANVPPEWQGTGFGVEVEKRLRAWVARGRDRALVVRYHPNQYHYFPDLGAQERVYLARAGREPVQPQLHASDTVIVQTSTVGLEAALIGKRVINLRHAPSVIDFEFDFSAIGLAEGVDSMDGMVDALEHPRPVQRDPRVMPPPAPAAPRVADEILDLARPAARQSGQPLP